MGGISLVGLRILVVWRYNGTVLVGKASSDILLRYSLMGVYSHGNYDLQLTSLFLVLSQSMA